MKLTDPSLPIEMKLHSLKMLATQIIEVVEALENGVIE